MSDLNESIYHQRIQRLCELLEEDQLDALIVTHDDEYLSYELNEDEERLKYITGFSGSAGYAVITRNNSEAIQNFLKNGAKLKSTINGDQVEATKNCAVFVDGRYVVQVKEQTDSEIFDCFNFPAISPTDWICNVLQKNSTVGIDLNCISYKKKKKIISGSNIVFSRNYTKPIINLKFLHFIVYFTYILKIEIHIIYFKTTNALLIVEHFRQKQFLYLFFPKFATSNFNCKAYIINIKTIIFIMSGCIFNNV